MLAVQTAGYSAGMFDSGQVGMTALESAILMAVASVLMRAGQLVLQLAEARVEASDLMLAVVLAGLKAST